MILSQAIQDCRDYARHELGSSATTCTNYAAWQRHFARWLAEQGLQDPPVQEITVQLVRRYSYWMSGRGLRPRTVRSAIHALRALFAFLQEMGVVSSNPAREVRLPKKDAATRLLVTDEDLITLLEAAGRQRNDWRCARDRAALAILIFCGLRRRELLDLQVDHINLNEAAVLVQQGKGSKSRTVYLCDQALGLVKAWLDLRAGRKHTHDFLFTGPDGRRLGENGLHALLQDVKAIAGFKDDPRIKPHTIRHAAATRLMRNGADIRSIQAWLGHAQLTTTAIYLHTDEQQCRKIAPLAGFAPPPAPADPEPQRPDRSPSTKQARFMRRSSR